MVKIILASTILVLAVLGINFIWPFVPSSHRIEPSGGKVLIQNLQEAPKALPQKIIAGAEGAVKGVQTSIADYFIQKTGKEVVDLLKNLPAEQQEVIKGEYCSK